MDKKIQKITPEDCHKWRQNKLLNPDEPINPITKYKITRGKAKYRELDRLCKNVPDIKNKDDIPMDNLPKKRTILTKPLNKELCMMWMKNKYKNPITNYTISEKSPIFKELARECPIILNKYSKSPPISPKSDIKKSLKSSIIFQSSLSKSNISTKKDNDNNYFPDINDDEFKSKLMALKEIKVHKINKYNDILTINDFEKKANELCAGFDKSFFQYLMGHYLSYRMPYKSMLIYYSVGVGKTCTAITIAENFLISHNSYDEPKIWVIMPGSIEDGFKQQIFKKSDYLTIGEQCTGDLYVKLGQLNDKLTDAEVDKRIKKIIKSRYQIFTYEGFANYYDNNYTLKGKVASDKVIIVDEAHNIRQGNSEDKKRVYSSLIEVAKTGINNKLILLSATPMYNEPTDIYDLIELLLLNDRRDIKTPKNIFDENNNINKDAKDFLINIASNYISYLRGKNPFNFAFKLSPIESNIPILSKVIPLTENGNPIESIDNNWIDKVKDGIVISKLGKAQIKYLEDKKIVDENIQNNFKGLQPMNIVYENAVGSKGFYNKFFRRNADKDSYSVSYNPKYMDALMPDENNLGLYSGKILNVLNIISKTKGITIIYSKYLHSGIIPVAIALEHMGYSRYGTDNILTNPTIIKNKPIYEGIKNPRYCILTSDNQDTKIMGGTTISKLINTINNPSNIYGNDIKVILMTPVAGEGLNIFNVREIHLLEAWYHFNRIDQIIGRGIRNCSHKRLPINERNVTVFMHCAIDNYERETADVHAYRISSRKLHQSFLIDAIIRNNSIDCSLFKDINYFPKSMFKLGKIPIETSQGVKINYELGDDPIYEPKCNIKDNEIDDRGFRQYTYKHLSLNIQMKLKKLLLQHIHNEDYFITYIDINNFFNDIDYDILMYAISISIYPNILIDGYIVIPHENGLHLVKVINDIPMKIALVKNNIDEEPVELNETDIKLYKTFAKFKNEPITNAIIALYSSIDLITFEFIIKKILSSKQLSEIDNFIANCLYREGALIASKEIPSLGAIDKYIGFINIFNDTFEPLLYNNGDYKTLNPKQKEQLLKNRKYINYPDMNKEKNLWGLFVPEYTDKKEKKNKHNQFKLLTAGAAIGKKTGIVCTSLHKPQHLKLFQELGLKDEKLTKEKYCLTIANELYKNNRIILNPSWKPSIFDI